VVSTELLRVITRKVPPRRIAPLSKLAQNLLDNYLLNFYSSVNGNYRKLKEDFGHGRAELPPLWVDIQESIEEKINKIDDFCKLKCHNVF
jgi:hypothetical protein